MWYLIGILIALFLLSTVVTYTANPKIAVYVASTYGMDAKANKSWSSVDSTLVLAIIAVESSGNPNAVGGAGERGLMQLKPGALADANKLLGTSYSFNDLFQPHINILAGTAYFSLMVKQFSNTRLAIRAYNQGAGTVKKNPQAGQEYLDRVLAYHAEIGKTQ